MADGEVRTGAAAQLWRDLVREGEARAELHLPENVQAYLVFLLMRHLRDGALAGRTMALEWLQAMELAGRPRTDALRDVGDRCLLLAGWYPRLAERRHVSPAYFAAIGQGAYGEAAGAARDGYGALFAELAAAYRAMVRVLACAAAREHRG